MPEKNSTVQSNIASREKRNPGFAPIRRGLLEHWAEMSVNARAFYIWLHLTANWSGPKRGWVDASFEDMAGGNGWSVKTVQRTIEELEALPFIEVERATSQYRLTRIRILKYDREETDSAELTSEPSDSTVDKFDRTSPEGVDRAMDRGVDKFDRTSDRTSPPILQSQRDLQLPKKVKKLRSKEERLTPDVRRRKDAEQHEPSRKSFSPSAKRKKLVARLEHAVRRNGNEFDGELDAEELAAFKATRYEVRDPAQLSCGFVWTVVDVFRDHQGESLSPGILCSKIIDRCVSEQSACKKLGADPSEYFWPVDFQDHRDRLRAEERRAEAQGGQSCKQT
jgi:hypothetical protein